ncbi:putative hydrolase or acyltransferase of alpha/beta superfamily [Rhizobium leguminosarum bv. trifolii WSM2297]|uniref:Putative hydrolase or acyltransferase of alpha/beta superfamily n=1 Tax=Rhizobium leguminosarum bv. trifolii WSM2297 TaxID=754762 RepID=J0CHA4_RHILT|nr:alpha/beta hydrolase [Rhizobium leguminosarum]EJC82957.1 putative hydrolase or acyltransferase of alpha/beta superfamily [Rhizobium leguminosarum bv. trifolii WSM2297]
MFDGFELTEIETSSGNLRVRHGGSGQPVLLLHGHPRTHMTWGGVADLLADRFTVVCPDLPGFGRSYVPPYAADSTHSSKRAKAAVLVEMMTTLGHRSFDVVGHDRGALTAFRMAMDHQGVVRRLVTVDGLPVLEHLERADWKFARDWYHWFFFAEPEKPERAILADPVAWYSNLDPDLMGAESYNDLLDIIHNPGAVHGMVEDYRAGIRIDHEHDRADRAAGKRVTCPMLCLWSTKDDLEKIYGDPVAIWRGWADEVTGFGINSGHHVAEENPTALAEALSDFLR